MYRLAAIVMLAILAAVSAWSLGAWHGIDDIPAEPASTGPAAAGWKASDRGITRAQEQLGRLPVRAPAPMSGYDREQFGPAWSDDVDVEGGHDGCDTRSDLLRRDLVAVTLKAGTRGCVVLTGRLDPDPYTGTSIDYRRGSRTITVHVDHVVSLGDAWQTGAQLLPARRRRDLANDPRNLQVVSAAANLAKGDSDAASWLPPAAESRCSYVVRQVTVKSAYQLWVTPREKAALARVLNGCLHLAGAVS